MLRHLCLALTYLCCSGIVFAQSTIKGIVVDAQTNEPLPGASFSVNGKPVSVLTNNFGAFEISAADTDSILVTRTGYRSQKLTGSGTDLHIALTTSFSSLDEVIVSANRDLQRRVEAPVAIQSISKTTINDTKATRLDMLINKIPGVFMVDLGNEQHSMSIRQPLGYNSLYLYLEDGIPIRTVGDFNHNALIEVNQASLGKIEVIKGPASSLYGSEAVGGAINFITQSPSLVPAMKVQAEGGTGGYRRTDFLLSGTSGKWGVYAGGYYAQQDQSDRLHNDFSKTALTLRTDYNWNEKTKFTATADYIAYKTDQKGGLDSAQIYAKDYASFYRFTYRKVTAFRLKAALTHMWNASNKTSFTIFHRNSAIGQNPFYSIADAGNPLTASGQINEDAFRSFGAIMQHSKAFSFLKARLITGVSIDFSPATYFARFIRVDKTTEGIYRGYTSTDSLLTRYDADLLNTAAYAQVEVNPTARLKLIAAARYDRMDYTFDNHLPPGAYTGAPDARNHYDHFTPKLGITYSITSNRGIYANYSVGFAPPNITELYRGVKVPVLQPSSYTNFEVGGWTAFGGNKGYAELSIYHLKGINEIVSVRLPDGTYQNQNAGETRHQGIEATLKYTPAEAVLFRWGGTLAAHDYIAYTQQGKSFDGNTMSQAPRYILNAEITYKPSYLKGFRLAVEWQFLSNYFTDAANTAKYKGFSVYNARIGYAIRGFECWMNCINLTDAIYATTVEKSSYGTSYRPGQLRTLNIGLGYHFSQKKQR